MRLIRRPRDILMRVAVVSFFLLVAVYQTLGVLWLIVGWFMGVATLLSLPTSKKEFAVQNFIWSLLYWAHATLRFFFFFEVENGE